MNHVGIRKHVSRATCRDEHPLQYLRMLCVCARERFTNEEKEEGWVQEKTEKGQPMFSD